MVEAARTETAHRERRGVAWPHLGEDTRGQTPRLWRCGSTKVTIPRHREINEYTAEAILKDLEGELDEGWWRK